jgi:hypothetical protein
MTPPELPAPLRAGYNNILEWAIDKERMEGSPDMQASAGPGGEEHATGDHASRDPSLFRTRESAGFSAPKSRPLYAKLELLLDLMFRRLFYDPSQAEIAFSYDGLLKLIKKIDKDMGP